MEGSGASRLQGGPPEAGAWSPPRSAADRGEARGRGLHASGRGWVDAERVARNRRNRRLRRTAAVVAALVVLLAWVGIAGGPGATPVAAVRVTLPAVHQVPAGDPAMPWPTAGESAVAVPAVGYRAQSGPEHPVPVASMTKVMTAYVVLHDHPLATGANGPDLTISPTDAQDFTTDLDTTQASVEIQAGEVLTERQALDGMLVHSANDLAYTLACWDAGSVPAFVAKMNATAASLGMHQTHYADASGYTPHSMSTAADLLKVTAAAMAYPAFAQAVSMPSVTLPVSGTALSYTPSWPGAQVDPGRGRGEVRLHLGGRRRRHPRLPDHGGRPAARRSWPRSPPSRDPRCSTPPGTWRWPSPRRGGGRHGRAGGRPAARPWPRASVPGATVPVGDHRRGDRAGHARAADRPDRGRGPPPQGREPGRGHRGHGAVHPGRAAARPWPVRTAARLGHPLTGLRLG